MTDMTALVAELKVKVEWQKTPSVISDQEYTLYMVQAIRELYVKTGRSATYSEDLFTKDASDNIVSFTPTLATDEYEYVLIAAQILYFKKVKTVVDNIVGYTNDAFSVTHADKPYEYLDRTLESLRKEKRDVHSRMVRFTMIEV